MLTLEGPSLLVDGILVLRDDVDPTTYYYVNDRPRIAQIETAAGETRGALKLIQFAGLDGDDPSGGLLFGDVDLGVSDDWINRARARIGTTFGVTDVNLRPPDWERGTVRFLVLGASNGQTTDDDVDRRRLTDPDGNEFEVLVDAASSPSLIGDNRAVFQAHLGDDAATLVRAALEDAGDVLPIGVIYDLTFLAKRPAFKVRVEANWDAIFDRLEEKFEVGIAIFQAEVDEVVQELVDEKHFRVVVDVGDPGQADTAQQMADELKTLVLEHFFEPMAKPTEAGDDTGNDVLDFLGGLKSLHTGVVGWSRRELHAEMRMAFDASAEVVRAVERRVFPQGHLVGLVDGADLDPDGLVQEVRFEQYMQQVHVDVRALVPWERHGIELVEVEADYGPDGDGIAIEAPSDTAGAGPAPQREFRFFRDDALGDDVVYRWRVRFRDDGAGPSLIASGDRTSTGGQITLDDNELYTWRDATIRVEPSIWDSFDAIAVTLQADGPDETAPRKQVVLDRPAPDDDRQVATTVWSRVFPGVVTPELSAAAVLRTPGGDEHVIDLEPRADWKLEIRNPLVDRLSVTCFVDGSIEGDVVLLEIDLVDPEDGLGDPQRVVFDSTVVEAGAAPAPVGTGDRIPLNGFYVFERQVPAEWPGVFFYRQIILGGDGARIQTRWRRSNSREIVLGREAAQAWPVTVRLDGKPFDAEDIARITVRLWVEDALGARSQERTLTFESERDRRTVVVSLDDPARPAYRFQVEHRDRFGRRTTGPTITSDDPEVVVPTAFPT